MGRNNVDDLERTLRGITGGRPEFSNEHPLSVAARGLVGYDNQRIEPWFGYFQRSTEVFLPAITHTILPIVESRRQAWVQVGSNGFTILEPGTYFFSLIVRFNVDNSTIDGINIEDSQFKIRWAKYGTPNSPLASVEGRTVPDDYYANYQVVAVVKCAVGDIISPYVWLNYDDGTPAHTSDMFQDSNNGNGGTKIQISRIS